MCIIESYLPTIREILNEKNVILVRPYDPNDLARGIKKALQNQDLADKILQQAFLDVQEYTWEKRADKIMNYLNK